MTEVATIVDIMLLKKEGLSKRAVAKRLKISRDTVSKYWNLSLIHIYGIYEDGSQLDNGARYDRNPQNRCP